MSAAYSYDRQVRVSVTDVPPFNRDFIKTMRKTPASEKGRNVKRLWHDAQRHVAVANWPLAVRACQALVQHNPKSANAWMLFGHCLREMGNLAEAESALREAVRLGPGQSAQALLLAMTLRGLNRLEEAEEVLRQIVATHPALGDGWNNLGNVLIERFKFVDAEKCFREALRLGGDPSERALWLQNLGAALMHQAKNEEAFACFEQTRALGLGVPNIESNRGALLLRLGRVEDAAQQLESVHRRWPEHLGIRTNLANVWVRQGKIPQARKLLEALLAENPSSADVILPLSKLYHEQGEEQRLCDLLAHAAANAPANPKVLFSSICFELERGNQRKASEYMARMPDEILLPETRVGLPLLRLCIQMKATYESVAEMKIQYENFLERLGQLENAWSDPESGETWAAAGSTQPFSLAYYPYNHRDTLARYGKVMADALGRKFAAELPVRPARSRIRVGVVSSHFRRHSVWDVITGGWFRMIDRRRFELLAYDLDSRRDNVKGEMESLCDGLASGSRTLEEWVEKIRDDAPDILVYPEIGMDCLTTQLAGIRLAPVQCVSWGHPVTSGLPTMDYYLSAQLLEPIAADVHYTEKLVRLPGLGVTLQPIDAQEEAVDLQMMGLTDTAVRIFCPQSIYKLMPTYDPVFVELAVRLKDCQFVFVENPRFTEGFQTLRRRLTDVFSARGLNMADYCKFVPWLNRGQFFAIMRHCTLAFDCPGFSGFTTAMQIYHHGLPMVTLEGEFMRQRLAAGILRRIGVEELVARTDAEFLDKIVRYATDTAARRAASQRLLQGMSSLYGDDEPIRALENFFEEMFPDRKDSAIAGMSDRVMTVERERMLAEQSDEKMVDESFDAQVQPWRFLDSGKSNHLDFLRSDYVPRGLIDLLDAPPRLVLDVGCFIGATGAYIKERWPQCRVVGIEPVAEAARQARSRVDAVFEGFFEDMPLGEAGVAPGEVDLAVFADVLEHMRHPWAALRRIREWLSPNGAVLVSLPNVRNLNVLKELVNGSFRYRPAGILDITHIRFFARGDALRMFEQTGFVVEKAGSNTDSSLAALLGQFPRDRRVKLDVGPKLSINDVDFAEAAELCALQFYFLLRAAR